MMFNIFCVHCSIECTVYREECALYSFEVLAPPWYVRHIHINSQYLNLSHLCFDTNIFFSIYFWCCYFINLILCHQLSHLKMEWSPLYCQCTDGSVPVPPPPFSLSVMISLHCTVETDRHSSRSCWGLAWAEAGSWNKRYFIWYEPDKIYMRHCEIKIIMLCQVKINS